ncbi:hypothetical protein CXU10_07900 [Akkermansia muciniphila]|nr:hypothetical protein CXU10_07900 [Akkermansia muciniphila]
MDNAISLSFWNRINDPFYFLTILSTFNYIMKLAYIRFKFIDKCLFCRIFIFCVFNLNMYNFYLIRNIRISCDINTIIAMSAFLSTVDTYVMFV